MRHSTQVGIGELSTIFSSSFVPGAYCFDSGLVSSNIDFYVSDADASYPSIFEKTYSFVATGIREWFSHVTHVLSVCAFAKIISAIVQCVVIHVVYFVGRTDSENHSVHCYPFAFAFPNGIVQVTIPVPLVEPLKIGSIHDSNFSLGQRDKAIGFIKRLSNCVTLHATFWHRSTSNGSLQLSRYCTTEGA